MEKKKQKIPQTVNRSYIVKINGQPLEASFISLRGANNYVKNNIILDDRIQTVEIVKEIVKQTTLRVFKPVIKAVLTADDLGLDLNEGESNGYETP